MEDMITTAGVFTVEMQKAMINNICEVFGCEAGDIENLKPIQGGLSNFIFYFEYNGGKYVYRYPGIDNEYLVERGRETIIQAIVSAGGIDNTLIAMDATEGWRVSRYVENRPFDYNNLNDMVRGIMLIRSLHEIPCKVRWNRDCIKDAELVRRGIAPEDYDDSEEFRTLTKRVYRLNDLVKKDGIKKCYVHTDARNVNFLINDEEIYLIDWEYGGYGDPGIDIGSYVGGGCFSREDVDRIIFTYYRHEPTRIQKRHMYAYIAITCWFYLHWYMRKKKATKGSAEYVKKSLKKSWTQKCEEYSELALKMYEEDGLA